MFLVIFIPLAFSRIVTGDMLTEILHSSRVLTGCPT